MDYQSDLPRIELIRIPPYSYLHVTNSNANVTRVITGPRTFTCMDDEVVVLGPVDMIRLPPRHFCIVSNPVVFNADGSVALDANGQARLRHGDREVRLHDEFPDPFPLHPGEELTPKTILALQVVPENTALRLRATRDFTDRNGVARLAGQEWVFAGHGTYYPQVEVEILDTFRAVVLKPLQALRLRARNPCRDHTGRERCAGESWLVIREGAYLPGVEEIVEGVVNAVVLSDKVALHLRADKGFVDGFGVERKSGDEYLVTKAQADTHIPDVYETVVGLCNLVSLVAGQYCTVHDPFDRESGRLRIGQRELRRGPANFFLAPGERLGADGICAAFVLGEEEALQITAREAFTDEGGVARRPGSRWMVYGPGEYVPALEAVVVARKRALLHIEGWMNLFFFITAQRYA
eukprot:c15950_g1_i1.p1 GENE.c15950_g1_i1~~c15950_g1_i1.p1  ORF type:complete len:408 (+),score=78.12 c15950_g1_i1:221-1444(+)